MSINIENNIKFQLWNWLSASTESNLLVVKWWKEALLPPVPFELTLAKFNPNWIIIQREIVLVTAKEWNSLTITRAYEACPINDSAIELSQEAFLFDEWDYAFMSLTAEMLKNIYTELWLKANDLQVVHKTWDETIWWNKTFTWQIFWDWSNLTWIVAEVKSSSLNYMLWSNWEIWKAYSLWNYEQLVWWTTINFWSTTISEVAQSFYWQDIDLTSLILKVKKVSSPTDNIFIEIQTDNAWKPSWTVVTNWTSNNISYSSLTTDFQEITFNFASIPDINSEQLYHIVLKRSSTVDAVNYYTVESAWSNKQIWTASSKNWTWSNIADDLYFKITWYKLAILWWNNYIWICQLSWNIWEITKFNTEYDNNQILLIPWQFYWFDSITWNIILW